MTHISGFNVRNLFFCRKRLATPQQIASVDALKIESAEFTIMRQLAMRFRGLLMAARLKSSTLGCTMRSYQASTPCSASRELRVRI
jgi:hypothetical protein